MAIIQSGSSSSLLTIDSASTAARTTLYDISGNAMCDVSSLNNVVNALNAAVTFTLGGQATVGFNVEGTTGSLTLSFEVTMDNLNWVSVNATPVAGGSVVTSTTTNGQWLADVSGFYAVRARVSAFSSGSMTVSLVITPHTSKNIAQAVTAAGTISISGTVTANQGTAAALSGAWPVEVTDGTNILGTSSHPIKIDPTGTTAQPISGTVTANAGSGIFAVSGTVNQGTANTASNSWSVEVTDGTNVLGTSSHPIRVDPTGATTQPISGTVTANIGTTNGLALDATLAKLTIAQSAVLDANTQVLIGGSVTTAAPTYTTGNINPLSLTTTGALRTDSSGTTQPVSGTVTSNQGTPASLANAWSTKITDATNGPVAVKATSTAAAAADSSLVVALSPNSPLPNLGSVDSGNSSTAALAANATFTGTSASSFGYASISVLTMAIGATAPPGTLIIEQSSDGSNWDIQDPYSVAGGTVSPTGEFDVAVNLKSSFYRIVYTNGATAQTSFRLQTIKIPVYSTVGDAPTQKGVQASTFLPVQEPKDSGRVVKTFVATGAATVTTETMITLTPSSDFVTGVTGTSFAVTSGKRLRLQSISIVYKTTAATALAGLFRVRISSSGAVTTATQMAVTLGTPSTAALVGAIQNVFVNFPDGMELSGTMQFGVSQLSTVTTSLIDVTIIGYEY